jgi:hypothetical protein
MVNLPVPAYTKGMVVREMIEKAWMPRLEAFKPQMIFISAGFDAHREDDLGQLGLVEADYAWITERIKDIARKHAKGRIVSVAGRRLQPQRAGPQRGGAPARPGRRGSPGSARCCGSSGCCPRCWPNSTRSRWHSARPA